MRLRLALLIVAYESRFSMNCKVQFGIAVIKLLTMFILLCFGVGYNFILYTQGYYQFYMLRLSFYLQFLSDLVQNQISDK